MQGVFDSWQRDNIKYVYGFRYLPTFGSLFLCILESQGDFKEPSSDRIQLNVLGSLLLIQYVLGDGGTKCNWHGYQKDPLHSFFYKNYDS